MITLINGALHLGRQNGGHLFANWNFGNYDLTLTDPATLYGTTVLDHSNLTISGGPLDNNGTLIAEDGSDLTIQNNLTGSGTIVSVASSVLIAGSGPTSETIDLLDNSNLYLGIAPGLRFLSPINIDATSTIHFYNNPNGWASDLTSGDYNEAIGMTHPPADLIGGMAYVNSLTPGYQPEIIFQFASGPNGTTNYGNVIGVTIVDKPIVAAHS